MRAGAILWSLLVALVLATVYLVFEHFQSQRTASAAPAYPSGSTTPRATDTPSVATPPLASSAPLVFHIAISDVKPGADVPKLMSKQGDEIKLLITSDRPGTLEVHGYDQHAVVGPGSEIEMAFVAKKTGFFPIHLHTPEGAHVDLTALEVRPN